MKYEIGPNCNDCEPVIKCPGRGGSQNCKSYLPRKAGWMLAELALAHPTSLNEALSALPFEVNLNFYLKGV